MTVHRCDAARRDARLRASLNARLRVHMTALAHGLLERETAVRLLLLGALAGEHVLLIGPPGTAKSELARRLHRCIAGTAYFERLLTRFSTPEELFGPLSLKALEDDRYERLVDGYLPTAGIAFLDEVFKANSAILNALLTLLNEREFDNGAGRRPTPLVCLVGATNEAPADESLLAFHDRFLLRVPVAPVGDEAFVSLLTGLDEAPGAAAAPLGVDELAALRDSARAVRLGDEALAALTALRHRLRSDGLPVSDRRWRRFVGLLRVAAASDGRPEVDPVDLWLAPYVTGHDAGSVAALAQWVDEAVIEATEQRLPWFERAAEAFEQQLDVERRAPAEEADDSAGKLALARAAGAHAPEGGPMRIVSARLEEALQRRWSPVHVAARVDQVDETLARVAAVRRDWQARRDGLARRCADRLWLPAAVAGRWLAALDATLARLDALLDRLAGSRDGFAMLPQDEQHPADAPDPVAVDR
jgi:MoxR-like ATPase